MTISTSQATEIFLGNDATSTFSFTFVGDSAAYITVIYTNTLGVVTTLDPSQYTLFLNPPATGSLWGIGGTVTYTILGSPIATGTSLTVTRTLPLTQTTSISNQGSFAPEVIEQALDTLELQLQQISGRTGQDRGTWASGVFYNFGDYVIDGAAGANTGNYYSAVIPNTSGTWSTDLANGDWVKFIDVQAINTSVAAAAASASAAAGSATSASTSASSASTSATSASTSASSASTSATNAASSATDAAASATTAASYAAALSATSTTSQAIATGTNTFVTQSGKQFTSGQFLIIASNADATNYMHGSVTSYSGTSLVMNITDIGGSGAHSDWNISVSGTRGTQGPAGSSGAFSGLTGGTNTAAAMVVGTGASISASGSGAITATAMAASGLTGTLGVAHGGIGAATLAANNVLLGNGTSALQVVAPGPSGNLLTSNGTTWASSAATTGSLVLLSTQTASSSSTINFDNTLITSTYKTYLILVNNVIPASTAFLELLFSSNNGSTTISSLCYYNVTANTSDVTTYVNGGQNESTDVIKVSGPNINTSSSGGYSGTIYVSNPSSSAAYKFVYGQGGGWDNNSHMLNVCFGGGLQSTTAINYLRLQMNTGNIASGSFKLYGIS